MVAYNFAYNFAGKIEIEREKTPYTSEYILRIPRLCGIYYGNFNLFVNSPFKAFNSVYMDSEDGKTTT